MPERACAVYRARSRGAGYWAMHGAADALSHAAAMAEITPEQAQAELFETIVAMIGRSK